MERDKPKIIEYSIYDMTVGDKINHELHHLEIIPEKVNQIINLGIVTIEDPQAYIDAQIERIKKEIEELKLLDPSTPYYRINGEPEKINI